MTLKNAALLALVGMVVLSVLLLAGFIRDISSVANGLIPAISVLKSLVYLFTSVAVTVFFWVFHRSN